MSLKQYNCLQIKLIKDNKFPIASWIALFGSSFKKAIEDGMTDIEEIKIELYTMN